jgi:oxalate decarboxylase/phosphoglucose isomerase-like protein (cupin superfamily)
MHVTMTTGSRRRHVHEDAAGREQQNALKGMTPKRHEG